jgi:hypothetical protein
MRHLILALGLASALCHTGEASAQEAPAQTAPQSTDRATALPEPSFLTLDRVGTHSRWGMQLHTNTGYERAPDAIGLRADVFGRYVFRNRLGGYAQMSASHIDKDYIGEYNDASALNNIELGGLYSVRYGSLILLLRGGVVLPTATWNHHLRTSTARLIDYPNIAPDGWWTRLSVSPRMDWGILFMQFDLGIDIPHGRGHLDSSATSPLVHIDGAVGVRSHRLALTVEGAAYDVVHDSKHTPDFYSTLAATIRFLGAVEPYIGVVRPYIDNAVGPRLVVSMGIEGTLP